MFNKPKKSALIFLVILLAGMFFPVFFCSAGTYKIMKQDMTGELCEVEYSGIVPCGKCLKAKDSANPCTVTDNSYIETATQRKCGVKTGLQIYLDCQLCHFFLMLDGILDFVLIKVIPPLALLMLVIGGVMFYLGGAKPDLVNRGKRLITSVAIGLFLIYGAYMITGILLKVAGAAEIEAVSQVFKNGVFSIDCPIKLPSPPTTTP